MKLFEFPSLIQTEIFDHLCLNNIFFLSLCSQKAKNLVFLTQKQRLKSVKSIQYEICGGPILIHATLPSQKVRITGIRSFLKDVPVVKIRMSGKLIDFHPAPIALFAQPISGQEEAIIEAIHNELYEFFGIHTKIWSLKSSGLTNLPKLKGVRKLEIMASKLDGRQLEEYLSGSPNLEVFCFTGYFKPKLSENSKLYQLDTIEISGDGNEDGILKYFNGRYGFLWSYSVIEVEIIEFLNKWKSGKNYGNLELMFIEGSPFLNLLDEIREGVEFKELDKEVMYPVAKKHDYHSYGWSDSEFKSRYYLVRDSDGRVASVAMERGNVMMGVWNMGEMEFLKKFDKD